MHVYTIYKYTDEARGYGFENEYFYHWARNFQDQYQQHGLNSQQSDHRVWSYMHNGAVVTTKVLQICASKSVCFEFG